MLRAVFVALVSLFFVFLLGTPLVAYAAITGNTDPLYQVARFCVGMVLRLSGVQLEVSGRDRIPLRRAVVFMPNHESNADAPAIFVCLPPVLVLGKKEFFRIPILGRAMRMRGFIPVDRKNRKRAIEAVEEAARALRAGNSFLVFPEGTRSSDGRLQTFKKGPFIMALKAGAPIVPVSISGGRRIMPKGEAVLRPGRMRITFHEPVLTATRSLQDREQVMAEVRQAILSSLTEEEWPLEQVSGSS